MKRYTKVINQNDFSKFNLKKNPSEFQRDFKLKKTQINQNNLTCNAFHSQWSEK
jgi:hypothetical protein